VPSARRPRQPQSCRQALGKRVADGATPLQALLVAERAALLSGRDDDFTMVVTMGYTGMFSGGA
jgi:hypothetical protein